MMNFLQQLLGAPPAQAGIPETPTYSPALERAARKHGFRSADEMVLWQRQRDRPSGGTIAKGPMAPAPGRPSLDAAMSWHPANILAKISAAINGATGN